MSTAFSPSPAVVAPTVVAPTSTRVPGTSDLYVVDGDCASFLKDKKNTKLFKAIQRKLHNAGMGSFYGPFLTRNNEKSGLTPADICILQMMLQYKLPTFPGAIEALRNVEQEDYDGLPYFQFQRSFEGLCDAFICDWYWMCHVSPNLRNKEWVIRVCETFINHCLENYPQVYGTQEGNFCLRAIEQLEDLEKSGTSLESLQIPLKDLKACIKVSEVYV